MNWYPSKYPLIVVSCLKLDSSFGGFFCTFTFQNPYDSFMKKHLQHYGYFTGKLLFFDLDNR